MVTCRQGRAIIGAAVFGLMASVPVLADHMPAKDAGMALRDTAQSYIAENGIQAAIAAVNANKPPFASPYPAVAILAVEDGRVIQKAHTLYQELVGVDLTDIKDLEGRTFIRDFLAQARDGGGAAPTTNAPPPEGIKHKAECYNEWAEGYRGQYFLAICYARPGSDGG